MYLGDIHAEMRAEAGDAQERYADEEYTTPTEVKTEVERLESLGYDVESWSNYSGSTWYIQYIKEWVDEDGEDQIDEGETEIEIDNDWDDWDDY